MRIFNHKTLYFLVILALSPLQATEEAEQIPDEFPEGFALGFEIETKIFKIRNNPAHPQELVFKAYMTSDDKDSDVNELWHFTSDTLDSPEITPSYANIELKTIGGIISYQKWLCAARQVQNTFNNLAEKVESSNILNLYEKDYLFESLGFPYKWVNQNYNGSSQIHLARPDTSEEQKELILRPQTTIQTPLEYIPYFFTIYGNKYKRKGLKDIIEKEQWNQWKGVSASDKARGFACLLTYYVKELFCYKVDDEVQSEQPGPKSRLSLMSRIPFSDMWETLDARSQQELMLYMDNLLRQYGTNKIIPYFTYRKRAVVGGKVISDGNRKILDMYLNRKTLTLDRNPEEPRITLREWLNSISDPEKRRNGKDLLSPPLIDYENYSMGLIRREASNHHALLEVRCHPRGEPGAVKIDNLESFLINEAQIVRQAVIL